MPNRVLLDERIRARDLFIYDGFSLIEIASKLNVHIDTVRTWSKKENWPSQREEVLATPQEIGRRLKRQVIRLLDEIDDKHKNNEGVSQHTLRRLDQYTKSLLKLDGNYDEKGAILLAMKKFLSFLTKEGNTEAIKVLDQTLPAFYQSLRNEY